MFSILVIRWLKKNTTYALLFKIVSVSIIKIFFCRRIHLLWLLDTSSMRIHPLSHDGYDVNVVRGGKERKEKGKRWGKRKLWGRGGNVSQMPTNTILPVYYVAPWHPWPRTLGSPAAGAPPPTSSARSRLSVYRKSTVYCS